MGYAKVIKKQDIENFIESVEYACKSEEENLSPEIRAFLETFVYEFDQFINKEIPQHWVMDLEKMPEKTAIFKSSHKQ